MELRSGIINRYLLLNHPLDQFNLEKRSVNIADPKESKVVR